MEQPPQHGSHLFTVRLWYEHLGEGQAEWRGQVSLVATGEAHYFREWSGLAPLLISMLPKPAPAPGPRDQD